MKSLGGLVLSLSSILLANFAGRVSGQASCPNRWFGDNCKFQCHCAGVVDCAPVGDCPFGCEIGWFGPQCQFVNVASDPGTQITDGNDGTCLLSNNPDRTFPLSPEVSFTWMRIVSSRAGLFDKVNIIFKSRDGSTVNPATPLTRVYVSDTVMDVHGELPQRIQQIQLLWESSSIVRSFCSLYVSGGRNVALKQETQQSTVNSNDGVSENAVDGGTSGFFPDGSCTHTAVQGDDWWTVNVSPSVSVDRYRIYNRDEANLKCRLRYFRLESFNNNLLVQQYDDAQSPQNIYNVAADPVSTVSSVNISVSRAYYVGKVDPPECNTGLGDETTLTLCEVQIFGDSVCSPGKWGRQCENDCGNCAGNVACFVATGSCPAGCISMNNILVQEAVH